MILYTPKKEVFKMEFGDIVYFNNIIFNNDDGTHEIDPYFNIGRPCVCIGEFEDYIYFLPLTKLDDKREEKFFDIIINPDKQNGLQKVSKINYNTIIKKPISFFEAKGKLNEKIIIEIVKKTLTLYNCEKYENSDILSKIIADYAIKEKIKLVDEKIKNNNIEKSELSIGDIVLLKQIIFSNNDVIDVDHAFNSGRPCVFAGYRKNKMYFCPLRGYRPNLND